MLRVQPGRWLRVLFLPPGRYEYVFVVDGRCVADPNAVESVPNVYGCMNSVLSVAFAPPRNDCRRPLKPRRVLLGKTRRRCCSANVARRFIDSKLQTIA